MAHDCSDIRSSKAPSGISGSRWMTLSASQSRSNSDGTSRPCHLAGPQLPGRRCPESGHCLALAHTFQRGSGFRLARQLALHYRSVARKRHSLG